MGIIPFEEVPELLASGQNIYKMFDEMEDWSDEFYRISLNDRYNLLNKKSNTLLYRRWYNDIYNFYEGFAGVELNGKYGFIDKTGREVIPCKYDYVWDFEEGLAGVELNGSWGVIDKTGREICPCKYDDVGDFNEGFARVILNNKYGFIDKSGREVIPCKYDYSLGFSEGLAQVELNGKQGYIDKSGKWYDEKPTILPESINKITISDIRYIVNECINRLI